MTMKGTNKQPPFPALIHFFNGSNVCWGRGNDIVGPRLIGCIPTFTLYPEGSKKRKDAEKKYWKQKKKEYAQAKKLYENNIFIGTIWKGNTDMSARITKIFFSTDKQYLCYKASDDAIKLVEKENKKHKSMPLMMPPKPSRISLSSFLSMIKNKQITIVK